MTQRFKPFFVHRNFSVSKHDCAATRQKPRGFTAFVEPADGPREVNVRVTFCSSKDEFIKKEGRRVVMEKPVVTINARHLPKFLEEQEKALSYGWKRADDWAYIVKYML